MDTPVTLAGLAAGEMVDDLARRRTGRLRPGAELHRRRGAELGLDDAETAKLCDAVAGVCERRVDPALLAFFDVAFPAFQAGLWTYAGDAAQVARYVARLA